MTQLLLDEALALEVALLMMVPLQEALQEPLQELGQEPLALELGQEALVELLVLLDVDHPLLFLQLLQNRSNLLVEVAEVWP